MPYFSILLSYRAYKKEEQLSPFFLSFNQIRFSMLIRSVDRSFISRSIRHLQERWHHA